MAYELRIDGKTTATLDSAEAAVEAARAALQDRPDCEPEVFDTTTGKAFEPYASKGWREHLARVAR